MYVGHLIVGDGSVREGVHLGIENGVIREISEKPLEKEYTEEMDCSSKYVMPGLIDAHVHTRYDPDGDPEERSDEYMTVRAVENAGKSLAIGVTSLGDAGAVRNVAFAARNVINDGVSSGPRLFVSGEMITITGGRSKVPGERLEVHGPDMARKAARGLLLYKGADFIKLGATGAISSPHTGPRHPQLTVLEMRACVDEAHKCGRMVHAHCYGDQGISNSLEAGVDVIVHGQTLSDGHIRFMKDNDLTLLPTLKTFCGHLEYVESGGVHTRMEETGIWMETEPNFRKAYENGLTIAMGTDAGMPDTHFDDNYLDLKYMVNWGMTPGEAVTAGTLNAAKCLGVDDRVGTLETGKFADMLVLGGNPLEKISCVWRNREKIFLNGVHVF